MKLIEDAIFFYDPLPGRRTINLIERFLCHFEDPYAGQPFLLMPWQKQVINDVMGWKNRATGYRRFKEVYIEISKGNGKSPMISAWAMALFCDPARKGFEIISVGGDYKQAMITFTNARKFVEHSKKLDKILDLRQYEITDKQGLDKRWFLMSGTGDNAAGFRPSILVGDEVHEWHDRRSYDSLAANCIKKPEPLILLATNAGVDRTSICWELHQRAQRVIDGISNDTTLYPCIYAADPKDDWSDEKVWAKANPSLGTTITIDALRSEYIKAKENPPLEARFRRLFLSQWLSYSSRWLDLAQWDKAAAATIDEPLKELPLFLGMDLAPTDDLSSIVGVWVGKKLYVKCWIWLPKATGWKYQDSDNIPFNTWAEQKHVKYLDADTLDDAGERRLTKFILKLKDKYNLQTVAYDRAFAKRVAARLENEGVIVLPIKQDFLNMGPPTLELQRRIKAQSIVLPDNPCLRWQASNAEVQPDRNGLIKVVKEGQKGQFAGKRHQKIDSIVALILAISEVQRHELKGEDVNGANRWDGSIVFA